MKDDDDRGSSEQHNFEHKKTTTLRKFYGFVSGIKDVKPARKAHQAHVHGMGMAKANITLN